MLRSSNRVIGILFALIGRKKEAEEVFQLGTRLKAQPIDRLERKFVAFQQRLLISSEDPVEEVEPTRTALAQTFESMAIAPTAEPRETRNAPGFNVFNDEGQVDEQDDGSARWPEFGLAISSKNLGSEATRRKENTVESTRMAEAKPIPQQKFKKPAQAKIKVFSDTVYLYFLILRLLSRRLKNHEWCLMSLISLSMAKSTHQKNSVQN
jgi:hypothetical protein